MGHDPDTYVDNQYPASETTARIIGAAQRVHRELGPGFREKMYQRAFALELPAHGLEFVREERIPIHYRGREIGRSRVDFVVEEVMVEIKASGELEPQNFVQALSHLRASGYQVGLLINFGSASLVVRRLVHSNRGEDR